MVTPKFNYMITNRAHVLSVFEDKVGTSLTYLRAPYIPQVVQGLVTTILSTTPASQRRL